MCLNRSAMLGPGSCPGAEKFSHTLFVSCPYLPLSHGAFSPTKLSSVATGPRGSSGQVLLETGVLLSHSPLICSFLHPFIPCTLDSLSCSTRCPRIRYPEARARSGTGLHLTANVCPMPASGALARHWEQRHSSVTCCT